jgi:uncharacterized metal-binding protein
MEIRELNQSLTIEIIDNVSGDCDEIISAVKESRIHPGFGLSHLGAEDAVPSTLSISEKNRSIGGVSAGQLAGKQATDVSIGDLDCLSCKDRVCLRGEKCHLALMGKGDDLSGEQLQILQLMDSITHKHEGKLCRLAELVSFCLEMKYERVGIAFCIELLKQAEIVTAVLRRFFEVFPVCCQVVSSQGKEVLPEDRAGAAQIRPPGRIRCNPVAQAEILNRADTDLNVMLGLSLGADCLFTQESRAPVTTLFVKDKSVEDDPICIAYSKNYLTEIALLSPPENQSG